LQAFGALFFLLLLARLLSLPLLERLWATTSHIIAPAIDAAHSHETGAGAENVICD
jgi:hypothetical protein